MRKATFSEPQPKATLRFKPNDDWTIYGGYSRGFRSGGFNQTGVGAVAVANGVLGVNDIFQAEVVDAYEVGFKSQFLDRRLTAGRRRFLHPVQERLLLRLHRGGLDPEPGEPRAPTTRGPSSRVAAHPTDRLDLYAGVGFTDSRITAMADPTVIGNQAPLVSRNTINAGVQYKQPLAEGCWDGAPGLQRNRTHLVGTLQHHLARPGLAGGSAYGAAGREVDSHGLVQESHQHDL